MNILRYRLEPDDCQCRKSNYRYSATRFNYAHADALPSCSAYKAGAHQALRRHTGFAARCNTHPRKLATIVQSLMITKRKADVVPELRVSSTWCHSCACISVHTTVGVRRTRAVLRRSSVQWQSAIVVDFGDTKIPSDSTAFCAAQLYRMSG